MKNKKRKLSLLLALILGITPILSSFDKTTTYAEEVKETKLNKKLTDKLGIELSDIEFCNFDISVLNKILLGIQSRSLDGTIGIASESIETETFTWGELLTMYNVQRTLYDLLVDEISLTEGKYLIEGAISSASSVILEKLKMVFGLKIYVIYKIVTVPPKLIDLGAKEIMKKWLRDGMTLMEKALNSGKKQVTIKYMKVTWKTSGHSIMSGGAIIK